MDSSEFNTSEDVHVEVASVACPADQAVVAADRNVLPSSDVTDTAANSDEAAGRDNLEVICGFTVHPLARRFPLIVGKEFEELVDAVRQAGTVTPVELHNGMLIDGRNRGRAIEELRRQGVEIDLPTVEWQPTGDETLEQHIFSVNVHRRHLTPDQRVALALAFLPDIQASREARQLASRFGNRGPDAAANDSPPPAAPPGEGGRSSKEKDANSSVGVLCEIAGVGLWTGRQAVALANGIEDGTIDAAELDAVTAGTKPLRKVLPCRKAGGKKKPRATRPDEGDDELTLVTTPIASEEEVRRRWENEKSVFAVADHRELRRLYMKVIRDEQQKYDQ